MRRRRVLSALALAAGSTAGCLSGPAKTGPKWGPPETEPATPTEDESTLSATPTTTGPGYGLRADFEYATSPATNDTTDGFAIVVTVENTVDESRTAKLVVTWERDDETRVEERRVSVDAGGSTSFRLTFPSVGNLSFDWRRT